MEACFTAVEAYESIQDSFFSLDGKWRITYANRMAAHIVGRRPEELWGKVIWEEFPALVGTAVDGAYHTARLTGMVQRTEMEGPAAGTWYSILAVPVGDELHVYGRDITKRRQTEENLRQSERREAFLLRLSDFIRPINDPLDIQEASARMLGEHLDVDRSLYCDIIMKGTKQYFVLQRMYRREDDPLSPGLLPVETLGYLAPDILAGRMIVSKDLHCGREMGEEERRAFRILNMRSLICVPLSKNGISTACFCVHQATARDWTPDEISLVKETAERTWAAVERAKAQAALKESRAELRAELDGAKLLQSVSLVFFHEEDIQALYDKIVDAAARIMQSQAASLQVYYPDHGRTGGLKLLAYKGLDQAAADAWEWVDITAGTPCATAWRTGRRVFVKDVKSCDFMARANAAAGFINAGINSTQATPLYSRGGQLLGMISTHWHKRHQPLEQQMRFLDVLARQAADLIERRQSEAALRESQETALQLVREMEEADRNKNEFIGVLSHELRNPLAAISMGLQLLGITTDRDEAGKTLQIMTRQMHQLCHLVDDLLDLTRITHNIIRLKKERLELNELARLVAEELKPIFDGKGVSLAVCLGEEPLYLHADPVRLRQIIGNLMHNALKFTDMGGEAALAVYREGEEAVICVRDSGIGIRPDVLPRLFEPFTQADHSLERGNSGLGLGLAIVRNIAVLHGGSAGVQSEGLGKGSRFLIRLPMPKSEETVNAADLTEEAETGPMKVLLVEDNQDYASLVCSMLKNEGHQCACAANGAQGIKMAKMFKPDVIFCDIGLPVLSGFEVAREIRGEPALDDVLLVAMTGYAGQGDVQAALKAGFHQHLSKPIDMASIRKALESARKRGRDKQT